MDTIIFFCRKRDIDEPMVEAIGQKTYLLIRVGLNVGRDRWFGWKLEGEGPEDVSGEDTGAGGAGSRDTFSPAKRNRVPACGADSQSKVREKRGISIWKKLGAGLGKRKTEKRNRLEQERRRTRRQAMAEQVRQEIRSLSADILALVADTSSCRCVYEDSVRDCLVGKTEGERGFSGPPDVLQERRGPVGTDARRETEPARKNSILQQLWRECWHEEEFLDYGQWEWVSRLLPQATQVHFVILGNLSCGPKLLEHCARQMKSLRWFLPKEEYTEELEDFLEDFYDEYGLAAALQLLSGSRPFSRLRLECREPCNVLDFTGEVCVASSGLPGGSVWIDMASWEKKERRLAVRGGVKYVSLKEYWKRLPKRTKPGFCLPANTSSAYSGAQLPLFMRQGDNEM